MDAVMNLILIGISAFLIVWLARRALRNARRLNRGIETYHKEQEESGPVDPFSALSQLYSEDADDKRSTDK